jgi:hypothetical protein
VKKTFTITYVLSVDMTEEELYPDGLDFDLTPKQVKDLIESSGGMKRVIEDWNLHPCGILTVHQKDLKDGVMPLLYIKKI